MVGDEIAVAPTGLVADETEYFILTDVNLIYGVLTLDHAAEYYHYGAATSTGSGYNGVDMRGEVLLLTRNVKITSAGSSNWGCNFFSTTSWGSTMTGSTGSTLLDNVEIKNCGQRDTDRAAFRTAYNTLGTQTVINSVIWQGLGWGVNIMSSSNIHFERNIVLGFSPTAFAIRSSDQVTVTGNYIGDVFRRFWNAVDVLDNVGAYYVCALWGTTKCNNVNTYNNVIFGASQVGAVAPGHNCNANSNRFKNNVVHSIEGNGAIIYRDPTENSQGACYQASHIVSYKTTLSGVTAYSATSELRVTDVTVIDNGYGIAVGIGREADELKIIVEDSHIYGESVVPDCPSANWCDSNSGPQCINKAGFVLPWYTTNARAPNNQHQPHHLIWSDGSWGGETEVKSVRWEGFTENTFCGKTQKAIVPNPLLPDYQ